MTGKLLGLGSGVKVTVRVGRVRTLAVLWLNGGFELTGEDADGADADAVALGVLEEGVDVVEAHGLVVDEAGVEFGGVVDFEPAGGVGDESEGDGVAFGEAIQGEGANGMGDFFLHFFGDAFGGHVAAEFVGDRLHFVVGAFVGHGAAEFVGFGAGEVGDEHGHAEDLLLEKGDAEGALEDGFENGVDVVDFFEALAAVEVGMGEFADDGAGADDSDFDRDVVEAAGFEDGEGVHLGAGFDLEGADGVGAAHEVVGGGVVFGDLGDVDWFAALFAETDGALPWRRACRGRGGRF